MNKFFRIIAIVLLISMLANSAIAAEAKIAAIVNNRIITVNDVENRVKLYLMGKDMSQISQAEITQMTFQTMNELIDESIQTQEAEKFSIKAGAAEIEEGLEVIAQRNNSTTKDMTKSFTDSGVNISTLKNKIAAEIAWSNLISRRLYSRVSISDEEINMAIERIKKQAGKHYLLAEILLMVPEKELEQTVKNNALELIGKIKEGAPFDVVARQISQSPGASRGGDLGWIQSNQLDENIKSSIDKMEKGQISEPIRTDKGWHIILLRDVKEEDTTDTNNIDKNDEELRSNISSQLGTQRLNQLAQHYLNDLRAMAIIERRM